MPDPRPPISFIWTIKPAANEYVVILDSTRGLNNGAAASVASGSAYLIPGTLRGRWAGATVRYTAACTTNNVTMYEYILTNNAAAATDWEPQGSAGTQTVTAGTTLPRAFRPYTPDFSLVCLAGAGAPGALKVQVTVTWSGDYLV